MVSLCISLSALQLKVCYFQVSGKGSDSFLRKNTGESFSFIMFYLLGRTGVFHWRTTSQSYKLFYNYKPQNDPSIFRLLYTLIRFMSTTSNQHSFTVSYLINKLGFSPESALKASKYVRLKTPYKPDSVISFLEKHGFSEFQIKTMVKRKPELLASDAEKTFSPKLNFFLSKGFSVPDLTTLLCKNPTIFLTSLDRQIIPFFSTYSNLIHSDEKIIKALKVYPFLLCHDKDLFYSCLFPNINILREHGVPESNIIKVLYQYPGRLLINPNSLKEILEKVEEIELDPLQLKFVYAVSLLASMSKSIRERKVDAFKKWGWSEKEIWECFRRYPECLKPSEGMIMAKMEFLVKMGIDSSRVVNQPSVLRQSLKKRIVPRALFAQHLLSKGLIEDFKLSTLFDTSEKNFLKLFVLRHVAEAPELLKLYKEKLKK